MENRCFSLLFYIIVIFLSLGSCRKSQRVSLLELKRFASDPENGLVQSVNQGDFTFEVIYRPKDLIIEQNAGSQPGALWDSTAAQLEEFDYFILRMSRNGKEIETSFASDPISYSRVVNYLNGSIVNDIAMNVDGEIISVINSLYVPSYGTSDASYILITFDSNLLNRKDDFFIIFEDTKFKTGRHEFSFGFESLERIPKLKREDG